MKRIEEGPPMWVESCMTNQEWSERYKSGLRSSVEKEPSQFDPNFHKGGKWRWKMGGTYSEEELTIMTKRYNELIKLLKKEVI